MKKLISTMMISIMTFFMIGCGGDDNNSGDIPDIKIVPKHVIEILKIGPYNKEGLKEHASKDASDFVRNYKTFITHHIAPQYDKSINIGIEKSINVDLMKIINVTNDVDSGDMKDFDAPFTDLSYYVTKDPSGSPYPMVNYKFSYMTKDKRKVEKEVSLKYIELPNSKGIYYNYDAF